ncbi:MAG: GNAT family N-acetyltransferase [Myxococcota bacterium]
MSLQFRLLTRRLLLRRPEMEDAETIYETYASDKNIGAYLGWPLHRSIEDTKDFIRSSHDEWEQKPAGPVVLVLRETNELIGSSGLAFDTGNSAATGYAVEL